MAQELIKPIQKPKEWLILLGWIVLIGFAGKFVFEALPYFGLDQEVFGRYWDFKWSLIGHISGGILALLIGPFQFWKALRDTYRMTHRWMGRIYLSAILIAAISSTHLAWTVGVAIHWTWALSLQGLAFAWVVTAGMAFIQIMRGKVTQHKEWMIRSYTVTFAFVLFRFIDELESVRALGSFVERGAIEIWISWAIPLLIVEVFISWNKKN